MVIISKSTETNDTATLTGSVIIAGKAYIHHHIETQKSLNYKLRNYKHFRERIGVGCAGGGGNKMFQS